MGDALFAAPRPIRYREAVWPGMGEVLQQRPSFREAMRDPSLPSPEIQRRMCEGDARITGMFRQLQGTYGEAHPIGALTVIEMLYTHHQGVLFEATPALVEAMAETDFHADAVVTMGQLKLPFDRPIYLRTPTTRQEFGVSIDGDFAELDGFYVRQTRMVVDDPSGGEPVGERASLEIAIMSRPVPGAAEAFDDHFLVTPVSWDAIGEDDLPIAEVYRRHIERQCALHPDNAGEIQSTFARSRAHIDLLLKILLYLNLPSARRVERAERSALDRRGAALGPKKRAKLQRKLASTYDRIEIGPESTATRGDGNGQRTIATHWRRGHLRNQPYGEGRQQHRLVWIQPMLVAAPQSHPAPAPKSYRLR